MIGQHIQLEMIIGGDVDAQSDIRLRLAFWGEEPGGYGCEDDDCEADEDAPAKCEEAISNVFVLGCTKRIVVSNTCLPL
jgi:hypothetical protein